MSYYEENGKVYYDEIYFKISGENLPDKFFDDTQEIEARTVYTLGTYQWKSDTFTITGRKI